MSPDPIDRDEESPGRTTPDAVYGSNVQELLRARGEIDRVLKERYEKRVAVLFSDVIGAGAYFVGHGDAEGRAMLQRTNDLLLPVVEATGGRVVKTVGAAILAFFERAQEAVESAIQMQLKMVEVNSRVTSADDRVHIRIGLSVGPAFVEANDLHGDTVTVAARVQAQAVRDQILVSAKVREETERDLSVGFSPSASVLLKGKSEPIQLFEVAWRDVTRRQVTSEKPKVDERYRVEELLGTGGMAAVWKAQDLRLGRPVAIKVLHRHLDLTPLARERFRREARTAASLVHDNIVQVFDYESENSREAYIAMELVEGRSLRRYLTGKGPIPDIVAAAIAHEVARGLAHAHSKGVVHRDVKPDNVLMSNLGTVKLGDFGIAGVTEAARLTVTGAAVGSPAYMAPEQLEGHPAAPTNDVFGLGITLYEMAAGRPPFDGSSPATVMRLVAECKFEHPQKFAPVGEALCTIILRAMARDPKERYADAAAMGAAIRNLLDAKGLGDPRAALAKFVLIDDMVNLAAVAASFSVESTNMAAISGGGDSTFPSVVRQRPSAIRDETRVARPTNRPSAMTMWGGALAIAAVGGLSFGIYSAHSARLLTNSMAPPTTGVAMGASPGAVIAVTPPVNPNPPTPTMAASPTLVVPPSTPPPSQFAAVPPTSLPSPSPAPTPSPSIVRPSRHPKEHQVGAKLAASKEVEPVGVGAVKVIVVPYCDHLYVDGQDRGPVHKPFLLQGLSAGTHEIRATQEAGKYDTHGSVVVTTGKLLTARLELPKNAITESESTP